MNVTVPKVMAYSDSLNGTGTGVVIWTNPTFLGSPLDHFYCCEWDPIFMNNDILTNQLI